MGILSSQGWRASQPWLALLALSTLGCGSAPEYGQIPTEAREKVGVNGESNSCPVFKNWLLLPQTIEPNTKATITVNALDPDKSDWGLVFWWDATSGAFSQPFAPATEYSCSGTGPQVLTLRAWDTDACESSLEMDVDCLSSDAPL